MLIRTPRDIGALIRDHRKRLKLDQHALAEEIGVSRQWVIEVEKGKPGAELGLVMRALDALGLTINLPSPSDPGAPGSDPLSEIIDAARDKP
ncbi:MAG: helix-turn-helix transcriptional regulator [Pseudomonadota bacterium]